MNPIAVHGNVPSGGHRRGSSSNVWLRGLGAPSLLARAACSQRCPICRTTRAGPRAPGLLHPRSEVSGRSSTRKPSSRSGCSAGQDGWRSCPSGVRTIAAAVSQSAAALAASALAPPGAEMCSAAACSLRRRSLRTHASMLPGRSKAPSAVSPNRYGSNDGIRRCRFLEGSGRTSSCHSLAAWGSDRDPWSLAL